MILGSRSASPRRWASGLAEGANMGMVTKIGIIGMGHVGAHVANAILYQGLASEIYCVDSIESKVAC